MEHIGSTRRETLSFQPSGPGSWRSETGQLVLCAGPGARLTLRSPGGHGIVMRGLFARRRMYFGDARGRLFQGRGEPAADGSFVVRGLRCVEAPAVSALDPLDEQRLHYAPNNGRFRSVDGAIEGTAFPEVGRFQGRARDDAGRERAFEGLLGPGIAVVVVDRGRSATLRVTGLPDGSYLLHGFRRLLHAAEQKAAHALA